jgi:hypothetical protein
MSAAKALVTCLKFTIPTFEQMTADLSADQLHWNPPGTAHSVAATWAHAALATDWQLQSLFGGGMAWFAEEWAGQTGVSDPSPAQTLEWAQSVRVDAAALSAYSAAVFAAMVDYVSGLSDDDLARKVDVSIVGLGEQRLLWCIGGLVVAHLNQLLGEIAAVRGMQGLRGYPF